MMHIRTRYLCACVALSDTALLAGGYPLQRISWDTAAQAAPDPHKVLLLLAANVALLLLVLCGFAATISLTRRGFRFAFKHVSRSFSRPSRA